MKKLLSTLLIASLLVTLGGGGQVVQAGVSDNVSNSSLEQSIGDAEGQTVFGLLRDIVAMLGIGKGLNTPTEEDYLSSSLVEKVNYLQKEIKSIKEEGIASKGTGASTSLFVYLPSTDALADYEDSEVTLFSPSGNQSISGKLQRKGGAYSTILGFDFSGDCTLQWTAINAQGNTFALKEDVHIEKASQEFRLGSSVHRLNIKIPKVTALSSYEGEEIALVYDSIQSRAVLGNESDYYSSVIYSDYDSDANLSYNFLDEEGNAVAMMEPVRLNTEIIDLEVGIESLDPKLLSWRTIRNICASGRADLFFEPGDIVYGGGTVKWYIVGVRPNAIKVWNKSINLGKAGYASAETIAQDYGRTWSERNSSLGISCISSELLTSTEAKAIPQEVRAGDTWWLQKINGYYYYVQYHTITPSAHGQIAYSTNEEAHEYRFEDVYGHGSPGYYDLIVTPYVRPGLWLGDLMAHKPSTIDYSLDEISTLCALGLADVYDLCEIGTELLDGWFVIEHKKEGNKDQLRLWKPESIGSGNWTDANSLANTYYTKFNEKYQTDCAFNSALISMDDANSTWFTTHRKLGYNYWTATTGVESGEYYRVLHSGDIVSTISRNESKVVPYVWIK